MTHDEALDRLAVVVIALDKKIDAIAGKVEKLETIQKSKAIAERQVRKTR